MIALAIITMGFLKRWPEIRCDLRMLLIRRNPSYQILREAVEVLYLGGATRAYTGALWQIVNHIDPEMAQLVSNDPLAAYKLTHPENEEDE